MISPAPVLAPRYLLPAEAATATGRPRRKVGLLREHLSLEQEKVVRLYFGLGCSQSFSATEIHAKCSVFQWFLDHFGSSKMIYSTLSITAVRTYSSPVLLCIE
jgi:hypothetical protein